MAYTSTSFPHELVKDVFVGAKGKSSIAKLSNQTPIAFSGTDVMVFTMSGEVNLVAEGGAKASHDGSNDTVKMVPLKIEYGQRVSDEFLRCADEKQLEYIDGFKEGFAGKIARGLDIMVMHGTNPKTGAAATTLIGTNSLDTNTAVTAITYDATDVDGNVESAIAAIGDYDFTGFAMSKSFGSLMAKVETGNGAQKYPELGWGASPAAINGVPVDVNSTVSAVATEHGYIGDFQNAFKWGYAANIPLEVIQYGDPDGRSRDLKRYNEVCLRAEAYIGWGILAADHFARVKVTTT